MLGRSNTHGEFSVEKGVGQHSCQSSAAQSRLPGVCSSGTLQSVQQLCESKVTSLSQSLYFVSPERGLTTKATSTSGQLRPVLPLYEPSCKQGTTECAELLPVAFAVSPRQGETCSLPDYREQMVLWSNILVHFVSTDLKGCAPNKT